jgi:hypothetical protein
MADWGKRAENRKNSTGMLDGRGISYTSHNNGAHLKVQVAHGLVDFWPGTGKWIDPVKKLTSRGVAGLLAHVQKYATNADGT